MRWLLVVLAGCGRVGYDAVADTSSDGGLDASSDRDAGEEDAGEDDAGEDAGVPSDEFPPAPTAPYDCTPTSTSGRAVYYVAEDGSDDGDGTIDAPWLHLTFAIQQIPDGAVLLVRPGTYLEGVGLDRAFELGVEVRSEVPYAARLRGDGTARNALAIYAGSNITIEGFDIAYDELFDGQELLVHIADDDGEGITHDITLRNNILHSAFANTVLKINEEASNVVIERNLFYDAGDRQVFIDVHGTRDVVVQDNVLFSDRPESETGSMIVVSVTDIGSERIVVRRNVLANQQGHAQSCFVVVGGDGLGILEADEVAIENNLLLGTSDVAMRAPFCISDSRDVLIRSNTIAGDMPAAYFGFFAYTNSGLGCTRLELHDNAWSDPTGTIDAFSYAPGDGVRMSELRSNLYWNAGSALPDDAETVLAIATDAAASFGDPQLPVAAPTWPRWNGTDFDDGSTTVCEVHERLAELGVPAAGSPLIDAAAPELAAVDDLRGRIRGAAPDLGAIER